MSSTPVAGVLEEPPPQGRLGAEAEVEADTVAAVLVPAVEVATVVGAGALSATESLLAAEVLQEAPVVVAEAADPLLVGVEDMVEDVENVEL